MQLMLRNMLGLLILINQSCAYKKADKQSPEINYLEKNQKFCINLPEDHSKGETWQLIKDFNHQIVEELVPVWHGNEKGLDYNLIALASGQSTLTFVKRSYQDTVEMRLYIVKIDGP